MTESMACKAENIYYLALYTKSLLASAADHMKAVTASDLSITAHLLSALLESGQLQNPLAG